MFQFLLRASAMVVILSALQFLVSNLEAQEGGSIGATVEQSVAELLERNEDFDAFGWPAKGRFTIAPEALDSYVEFNRYMWDKYRISWFYKPTVMGQFSGRPTDNATASFQHNILLYARMFENDGFGTVAALFNALQVRQLTGHDRCRFHHGARSNLRHLRFGLRL